MKKILFIINSLGSGGAERVSSKLINHYVGEGCEVHVALLLNYSIFYDVSDKVVLHNFVRNKRRLNDFIFWIKEIQRCVKKNNIDTIIAVGYKFGILSAFASKGKARVLIKATGDSKMNLFLKLMYIFFQKSIYKICLQKNEQKHYYPKKLWKKCIVINNPFFVYDKNNNDCGFSSKHIICIGRVHLESKCQDIAIRAFSLFSQSHPDFMLDIYGKYKSETELKSYDFLLKLIKELHLENKVVFHGEVKNLKGNILPSFACLHTSKKEGMPNAMIEAMLLGIPVISTKWPGIDSIISNGANGFVVEQKDYTAIAELLLKMINDEQLYKAISDSSYKHNVEKYKEENVFSLWDGLVYE